MKFNVINISKSYKENIVYKNFFYTFNSGLYILTGVNGIGKSTLLKMIAKAIYPDNDNYYFDSLKVAYLCEKVELLDGNVFSFLKSIAKINKIKCNCKELIKKWKIPNKKISNLSNGNKQKVAILMMHLTVADVYLFDEPSASLDEFGLNLFLEYIDSLIKSGRIVIISTHEIEHFKKLTYKELRLKCFD